MGIFFIYKKSRVDSRQEGKWVGTCGLTTLHGHDLITTLHQEREEEEEEEALLVAEEVDRSSSSWIIPNLGF